MDKREKIRYVIERQEDLATTRMNFNTYWSDVNEFVSPSINNFYNTYSYQQGTRVNRKMFDSTATLALPKFAAAVESVVTPRTQRWHGLDAAESYLQDDHEVKEYLDDTTKKLFKYRYSPAANFASQSYTSYWSAGKYGTGALFVNDNVGYGLGYRFIPLNQLYVSENHVGLIDTVFRKFSFTADQAFKQFGAKNLPDKIMECFPDKPQTKFTFIHAVFPNVEYNPSSLIAKHMKFYSCYVCIEAESLIVEGGYRTFPYAICRYIVNENEVYGRSPAMEALSDIKMAQQMAKTMVRKAEQITDPYLLVAEDVLRVDVRANAINYGSLDANGRPKIAPVELGGDPRFGLEMLQQTRAVINDSFLITLFQILVQTPNMTATEALLRAQEKGALLAPTMGRLQAEFLGPLIERELDILSMAGQLSQMPDSLIEAGGEILIRYESPLNKAQRASEGVAIMRTLEIAYNMAQADPNILKIINMDAAIRELADINGAPPKILRSTEEVKQIENQQAQMDQLRQMLQAAPQLADTAHTLAKTQALASQPAPAMVPR